ELYGRFGFDPPEGSDAYDWGRRPYLEALLGEWFELETTSGTWFLERATAEEIWELWSTSAPPFKAMVASLEPGRREEFHRAYVEYCEQFRTDGRVAIPREYLLVIGTRR